MPNSRSPGHMDERRFPWFLIVLGLLVSSAAFIQPDFDSPEFIAPMLFAFLPCVFTLTFFRRSYSLLGSKKRWPSSQDAAESTSLSSVVVGKWFFKSNSYALVKLFPEGLFLRIALAGSGFLRFDEIQEIEKRFGSYRLTHTSPALRNPLYISLNKTVLERLKHLDIEVQAMTSKTKLMGCMSVVFVPIFIVGFFAFSSSHTRHGAFSQDREHALVLSNGFLEQVYDLDLATGEKTRLERNWGPRQMEIFGYPDPGFLKWVRVEVTDRGKQRRRNELRYQGRTLTEGKSGSLSADGRYLAYAKPGRFLLRDLQEKKPPLASVSASPVSMEWSPEDQHVLVTFPAGENSKLRIFDRQGKLVWSGRGRSASWGPGKNEVSLLSGEVKDRKLQSYQVSSETAVNTQDAGGWRDLRWQPGGQRLLFQKEGALYLSSWPLADPLKLLESEFRCSYEWSSLGGYFVVGDSSFAYFNSEGELLHDYGLTRSSWFTLSKRAVDVDN